MSISIIKCNCDTLADTVTDTKANKDADTFSATHTNSYRDTCHTNL